MNHWLYSANPKIYKVFEAFSKSNVVWPYSTKVAVGDWVFIYLTSPHKHIKYSGVVQALDLSSADIQSKTAPYIMGDSGGGVPPKKSFMLLGQIHRLSEQQEGLLCLENLRDQGLSGMLMGPRKLDNNPNLLKYIKESCS